MKQPYIYFFAFTLFFATFTSFSQSLPEITYPVLGDTLVAGTDILITWSGDGNESVTLEYSIDEGFSWHLITDKGLGLSHLWQNIPISKNQNAILRIKLNSRKDAFDIEWIKTYGSYDVDAERQSRRYPNGDIIIYYETYQKKNYSSLDAKLLRVNQEGEILWAKQFYGSDEDGSRDIQITQDGGLIVCGVTKSNENDFSNNHGNRDVFVIKLDKDGEIEWSKLYGGSNNDGADYIFLCDDGNYVLCGMTNSSDGDLSGLAPGDNPWDAWIFKINKSGKILWQKVYSGSEYEAFYKIYHSDDKYFAVGTTGSTDGDIDIPEHFGDDDIWIVCFDENWNELWQKSYGGSASDGAAKILRITNNSHTVLANTYSYDGQVVGHHQDTISNKKTDNLDAWIFNLDSNWNINWQHCIGGSNLDWLNEFLLLDDKGYLAVGGTNSEDGDIKDKHGDYDGWIVKTDGNGNVEWQRCIGDLQSDYFHSLLQGNDGEFYCLGQTRSSEGEIPMGQGEHDLLVVKIKYNWGVSNFKIKEIPTAQLTLEIPNSHAPAKRYIRIPVLLKNKEFIGDNDIESISAKLFFNPTLLYTRDYTINKVNEKSAYIELDDMQILKNSSDTLLRIPFFTALGNSEYSDLNIADATVSNGKAEFELIDGKFILDGICHEGGTRLLNSTRFKTGISQVIQKSNHLEIDFTAIEKGKHSIYIYDIVGKRVRTVLQKNIENETQQTIRVDISEIPQGKYFLIFNSPTFSESQELTIIR
jgi:hypothetical protein